MSDPESDSLDHEPELPFRQLRGVMPFRPVVVPDTPSPVSSAPDVTELAPRYRVRETEAGSVLRGKEAPGLKIRIDRTWAFSEVEARKLGERVILLDGAGQFGPLIDDSRHLYNLDHHRDCLRAFTLATCEQALILVLKGLDLESGEWTIYANEPDLDTIFAIWVLLNHRRLRHLDDRARDVILPLLRLEGAIDANGLEVGRYCGLPKDVYEESKKRLDELFAHEQKIKSSGNWGTADLYEHTLQALHQIDCWVYDRCDFEGPEGVDVEYGMVDIGQNRVALVVGDSAGIYEVEETLRAEWGERLGIIALARDARNYTLRRSASLAGIDLFKIYDKLNLLDPVVDGRPPGKRWGGSDDIGGSPRPEGTGLLPQEIAKIIEMSCAPRTLVQRLRRLATVLVWSVLPALLATLVVYGWRAIVPESFEPALHGVAEMLLGAGAVGALSIFLIRRTSRGWLWTYGWRRPTGDDWIPLLPLPVLAAMLGGLPTPVMDFAEYPFSTGGALFVGACAVGLWATSLLHGLLVLEAPIQSVGGRWFISAAALTTGLFCAVLAAFSGFLWPLGTTLVGAPWNILSASVAGFVCGLSLSMVRERSLSFLPAIVAAFLGLAARIILDSILSL